VRAEDAASADDLARQFGVSIETIRRDLRTLQQKGLLERVYGGAARPSGRSSEGSFSARTTRHAGRKRAIAALAASLVGPEETVIIDVGTTALEVARALPGSFRGRVLTRRSAPCHQTHPPVRGRSPTAVVPPPATRIAPVRWRPQVTRRRR